MKGLVYSLVWLGCVVGIASVQAQERERTKAQAAVDPAQTAALSTEMNQVETGLNTVRLRLGLVGSREKGGAGVKDEEVLKLTEASMDATKALEKKSSELIKADAEGGAIVAQIEDIQKKMGELQQQQRDLEKSLGLIRQRLGLQGGRGEKNAPASENPEIAALRVAADAARKAVEEKVTERIKADADGAVLLKKRDELNAKIAELRGIAREQKAERKP